MKEKNLYELLKSERGAISELQRRSDISFTSIRRILRDNEWENLALTELAVSILEEAKERKQQKVKTATKIQKRIAQLA